jgi:T-lymphoma invasion and metastasis-inducing protein 1
MTLTMRCVCSWLTVKNWLIHKKKKVELAPKRTWKKYWVCLKGTVLLFYLCDENESVTDESIPRHMLGSLHCAQLDHLNLI